MFEAILAGFLTVQNAPLWQANALCGPTETIVESMQQVGHGRKERAAYGVGLDGNTLIQFFVGDDGEYFEIYTRINQPETSCIVFIGRGFTVDPKFLTSRL